jgi:hypothetical protein
VSDEFGSNARHACPPHELHRDWSAKKRKPARSALCRQVREIKSAGRHDETTKWDRAEGWQPPHMRTRAQPANAEGDKNLKRGARPMRRGDTSRHTLCACVETSRVGPDVRKKDGSRPWCFGSTD